MSKHLPKLPCMSVALVTAGYQQALSSVLKAGEPAIADLGSMAWEEESAGVAKDPAALAPNEIILRSDVAGELVDVPATEWSLKDLSPVTPDELQLSKGVTDFTADESSSGIWVKKKKYSPGRFSLPKQWLICVGNSVASRAGSPRCSIAKKIEQLPVFVTVVLHSISSALTLANE